MWIGQTVEILPAYTMAGLRYDDYTGCAGVVIDVADIRNVLVQIKNAPHQVWFPARRLKVK